MLIREILLRERAGQKTADHVTQSKQPFGSSLWLVRKIEDREMNGIKWQGKTALLPNPPGSTRYTKHFCLNGVVTDHGFGTFAGDNAIVANLKATIAAGNKPAQVRGEDTYFFVDKDGSLSLPNAILVVPKGARYVRRVSGIAGNIDNIVTYNPEEESLVQAVARVLKMQGANYMKVGMNDWGGMSMEDQRDAITSQIGKNFTQDSHGNTAENRLEKQLKVLLLAAGNKWDELYDKYHENNKINGGWFSSPSWQELSPVSKITFQYFFVDYITRSANSSADEVSDNYKDNEKAANYAKYAREQAAALAKKYNIDPNSKLNRNARFDTAEHAVLSPLANLWPQNGFLLAKNKKPQKVQEISDMFRRLYNDNLYDDEYQVTPETWTLIHGTGTSWVRAKDQPVMQKLFALKGDTKYYT